MLSAESVGLCQAVGVHSVLKIQHSEFSNQHFRRLSIVTRTSWFDEKAEHPLIHERVSQLQTFTDALADGMVTKQELAGQEQRLLAAMKKAEPALNDETHAKVTDVLVELTAYNIMRLLHELQTERMRMATQGS